MNSRKFKVHPVYTDYAISRTGEVFSFISGRILKQHLNFGYFNVGIYHKGKQLCRKVHPLVLEAFVGPRPPKFHAAHLNGKRADNRLENLVWISCKENCAHKKLHGTHQAGEKNSHSIFTDKQVLDIRRNYTKTSPRRSNAQALANFYGVHKDTIVSIVTRRRWNHL